MNNNNTDVLSSAVVVLVFGICWAPFHIDRLLWSFITKWTEHMHTVFGYVHILSGVLFYLSSAINPVIYNLLSSRFRERFLQLMCNRLEVNISRSSSPHYRNTSQPKDQEITSSRTRAQHPNDGRRPGIISGGRERQAETGFM